MPRFATNQIVWQAAFGLSFLLMVMTWIWYASSDLQLLGKETTKNMRKRSSLIFCVDPISELPIIASELGRSAEAIVTLARPHSRRLPNEQQPEPSTYGPSEFARELLLLIANRKFCRLTVAESPLTAIIFFE